MTKKQELFTIGHSTRTIQYFIDLLKAYDIELVVDVRTIAKSRHNPQFNEESLQDTLHSAGITYVHLTKLGGLRHALKDSINTAWHNLSFRGFADYMQTPPFWEGLEELELLAKKHKAAILCAEAVPWRCHRSLIADALTLRKWKVFHIQSKKTAKLHELTPFLHADKSGMLVYKEN
ncbi:MAG: DUF488 domain-containing protein [Verrucomicrobia bacterium]|nr:DUF488 domain-containing protein [Verrucomicrobiota bacterium]